MDFPSRDLLSLQKKKPILLPLEEKAGFSDQLQIRFRFSLFRPLLASA